MIDKYEIYNEIQSIYSILPPEDYPQTHEYLAHILAEEELEESPFDIVMNINESDRLAPMPDYLIDFVTDLLEGEIEEDNDAAMNTLGAMYYEGFRGFEQNFKKAVHYYEMAAERGNRTAQENLGYCYYYGRVGAPDYEKAFHYFALGAFDGNLISLYKIGDMYLNGLYVKKNEREAFYIYNRCLETMTVEAADSVAGQVFLRLGKMYVYGIGTKPDYYSALACYQKAEFYLFKLVREQGEYMYKKSLSAAIKGQQTAREKLAEKLGSPEISYDLY